MPTIAMRLRTGPGTGLAWILLLALAAAAPACRARRSGPLELYVEDTGLIRGEFLRFAGRQLDRDTARRLEEAHKLAARGDYRAAAGILSGEVARAKVPSLHSNLGVLYSAMGDYLNAQDQFRTALGMDSGCNPAREGLSRLNVRGFIADVPVTHEVEPNNTLARANNISLDVPVTAAVANDGDLDAFKFKAPDGPRDLLAITVENPAGNLIPYLRLCGADQRFILWNKSAARTGVTLTQYYSPSPGASYFLEVWGQNRTAGAYVLRVHPMKSFDAFEPNDDILRAVMVQPGARTEAGIMDARDSDFYQVTSAGSTLSIRVENLSTTLLPYVTLYGSDRGLLGFGPEVPAGAHLTHSIATLAGETYYVQVWGRHESNGRYALMVK